MKKLYNARTSPVARVGAFLLCLVMVSVSFWTGLVTVANWDDIWLGGNYYQSPTAEGATYYDQSQIQSLLELKQMEIWQGPLSYSETERMKNLEAAYSPDKTNFRFQVHDNLSGDPILSNLDKKTLDEAVGRQYARQIQISYGDDFHDQDDRNIEEPGSKEVYTGDGYVFCNPQDFPNTYNQYGWYSDGELWQGYSSDYDTRIHYRDVVLEYGIANPMTVDDAYVDSMESFGKMQTYLPTVAAAALITLLGSIALLVFLCSAAGRREDGTVALGWQERIPYDIYLILDFFLFAAFLGGGDAITYSFGIEVNRLIIIGLGVFTLLFATTSLALVLTTAVRLKTRTLWKGSLIGRFCGAIGRFTVGAFRNLPITKRMVWLFLLYLVGTFLTTLTLILIPVYQGFVLWCLCRWLRQWRAIREGAERILGGDPDFKIDARGMYKDLKQHAEQLNDLGGAIGSAVDEQLRSERFRAELITNVSHDLKTPLTSIINYVGLLKTVPLENPQAREYIEVLERKSQRLKKLTEDLVDASKASTGNLTVNLERLGMGQLICQALGEYEEKFMAKGLEVIFAPPADELYVWADGRHLWRIIDNLFSNCAKYALERTRIYLDLRRWESNVFLSVKNISSQALNVPPEQLMERFVRGEESRSTEGSGLGLSIARSLTDLQHGTFRLDIDGDLFKATVSFPEAFALPEPTEEAITINQDETA